MALHPAALLRPRPLPLGEPFPCCVPWEPSLGPSWLQALAATRWSEEAGGNWARPPWLGAAGRPGTCVRDLPRGVHAQASVLQAALKGRDRPVWAGRRGGGGVQGTARTPRAQA